MKLKKISNSIQMALAGMALAASGSGWALGLGEVNVESVIGQNLIAEVELLAEPNELSSLKLSLASSSEYQLQGLNFNPALIDARVVIKKSKSGKTVAQITTGTPITDSYVQVVLDGATSMGKVRRTYSIFIDPVKQSLAPVIAQGSAVPVMPPINRAAAAEPAAKLVAIDKSVSDVSTAELKLTNISQKGDAPGVIGIAKGYGRKQSIKHALFTIVPKGWNGFAADSGVKFADPVDWDGNRDWLSALDGLLASANLAATVDWNKKEITFKSLSGSHKAKDLEEKSAAVKNQEAAISANSLMLNEKIKALDLKGLVQATQIKEQLEQISLLNTQIAVADSRLVNLSDELKKVQAQNVEFGSSVNGSSLKIKDLTSQIDASKEKSGLLEKDLSAALKQIEHLTSQVTAAKAAMGRTESKMGEFESMSARFKSISQDLEASRKENGDLKVKIDAAVKDSAALQKDRESALGSSLSYAKMLDEAKRQISESNIELSKVQKAFELQSTQLIDAQGRITSLLNGMTPSKPEAAAIPSTRSLQILGKGSTGELAISSSGLNVSFSTALRQIVPEGWMVVVDPSIGNMSVSWNGNSRNWIIVLDEMLSSAKLKGVVDPVGRELKISK